MYGAMIGQNVSCSPLPVNTVDVSTTVIMYSHFMRFNPVYVAGVRWARPEVPDQQVNTLHYGQANNTQTCQKYLVRSIYREARMHGRKCYSFARVHDTVYMCVTT